MQANNLLCPHTGSDARLWRHQAKLLAKAASVSPLEVDLLLEASGWSRFDQQLDRPPPDLDLGILTHLWQRRLQERIPLQYLLGKVVWRDMDIKVSPAVLIPRPETELLIDLAVEWWHTQDRAPGIWVDLGTGSGVLALALAKAGVASQVYGVDVSGEALTIAEANRAEQTLVAPLTFFQGSWFGPLQPFQGWIQGMVSNPPYIPSSQLPQLQPEVTWHEPHLALDGGESGLEVLLHLIDQAPVYLQPGGFWAVEVMQGQAEMVAALLDQDHRYTSVNIHLDLGGIPRFVSACLPTSSCFTVA
jgi:release factor glutamine methyltransferase